MRIRIPYPVIVEGKYDKIKLDSIIEANIITSDGFGIFNSEEKQALLRRLTNGGKVIVLTDPDGAGLVIRNFLKGILKKDNIINLYIPQTPGKEKRKAAPSAEGYLGVEGIDADKLREIFAPFAGEFTKKGPAVTKADLFADGLSGTEGSAAKREAFLRKAGLPEGMSANAMLEAINILYTIEEYKELL